MRPPESEL